MHTDTGQGWTDSPTTELRWRVMRAMVEPTQVRDFARSTTIAESLGAAGAQIGEAFDQLAEEGLAVTAERRLAPGYTTDAKLTAAGLTTVERWTAATRSTLIRACASALLSWLDSLDTNRGTTTEAFLADVRGSYFGEPFPRRLVGDVTTELRDLGLIKAMGSMQDRLLMGELTSLGRTVLSRYGGDVEAWQHARTTGAPSVSIQNSSGVNVAQNSPHAHQTAVLSADVREQMGTLAAAAEQIIPTLALDPADQAAAIGHVAELRELAASPGTSTPKARKAVTALRDIVVNATGSATGAALVALADRVSTLF